LLVLAWRGQPLLPWFPSPGLDADCPLIVTTGDPLLSQTQTLLTKIYQVCNKICDKTGRSITPAKQ
jgi:hypothetical protein